MLKQLSLFVAAVVLAFVGYSLYKARAQKPEAAKEELPSLVITTSNAVPGAKLQ